MRIIAAERLSQAVAQCCIDAHFSLRADVLAALQKSRGREKNARARACFDAIIANAHEAATERIAICQDTGMPIVFMALGQDVHIRGDFQKAIFDGIAKGYRRGALRASIVADPLTRGTPGMRGGIIHTDIVPGSRIEITVLPKGFGCENKSALKMFKPTAELADIKCFIVDCVAAAGPDACPPYVVGVGIGGTADYASLLAKKALIRKLTPYHLRLKTKVAKLENQFLSEINKLNIGPMGLGGKTTALAVHIETAPTHIAGLPVAVNISCHALRSARFVI